ncbi:HAD family hydrolase [Candidatus Micrarchaeota archaeon]|nr:HAD family hydrolase [Candidatus Micrarchaeota archaeon]
MIRLIAFDLWNTLIRNTCHLGGIPSMVRHELGLGALDWRAYIRAYDEAFCLKPVKSLPSAMDELCRRCGIDVPQEKKDEACRQVEELKECVEPFDDAFDALRTLRKDGFQLVVLTNTNNPALQYAFQRAPVDRYVDAVIASCEEGLIKPDVRLFSRMLQRFRTRPHEALMVGDNVHNDVLAARAVGMHAVLLNRTAAVDYPNQIHSLAELPDYVTRLPLMPPGSVHAED